MAEPQDQEVERSPGQQLLDELHALNIGVEGLTAAVEDLTEVIAVAADIETSDEDGEDKPEDPDRSTAGDVFGELGSTLFKFVRGAAGKRKEPE